MRGLKDKVAVVAGGGSGIGAATAQRLHEEGAAVIIGDVNIAAAKALADQLGDPARATAVEFDITDEDSVKNLVDTAVTQHGRLDAMLVNAAELRMEHLMRDVDAIDLPDEIFRRTMDVNLLGHVYCTRYAVPHMINAGGGSLVYTSSAAADDNEPNSPAYAMSKAGVQALARHVASRWGKQGIRGNAVAPGMITTGHPRENTPEVAAAQKAILDKSLSNRLGRPEDLGAIITFLLSDEAGYITGQTIAVDGGLVLR